MEVRQTRDLQPADIYKYRYIYQWLSTHFPAGVTWSRLSAAAVARGARAPGQQQSATTTTNIQQHTAQHSGRGGGDI